ncbi:XRE family transcriptional regulator [Phyllobacterium salinisoli]|uniref:XRE family transcriptional regulator n=1 Tax=Phyllobacterium salinisoli TaxID=1899321 RepID=A0A368K4V3_9HYPH|nr:helix-turn-helix transcriptional regulator [Phyllobacterium salinisoli]RCS23402.1 XRE family transcriptional regulator [Phyllobacterium salinisoli]
MIQTSPQTSPSVGNLIQSWRRMRRQSQLDLASEAGISQRHLSFVESGRSQPSREMVLHLADHLAIPMRERNALLFAAGYAPVYRERALDDREMETAMQAVDLILQGHEPHPALAVDRHWNLISANRAVDFLLQDVDARLLSPPVNVLRLSLHPQGLGPRIVNYRQWRAHVIDRLIRQMDHLPDSALAQLVEEIRSYAVPTGAKPYRGDTALSGIAVPFMLATDKGTLSFLSTTTVFGTAVDITLSELVIESFFPADGETAQIMRQFAIPPEA